MNNCVEELFDDFFKIMNDDEIKNSYRIICDGKRYIKENGEGKKDNISIYLKIKKNREEYFKKILDEKSMNYTIIKSDKYSSLYQINNKNNYIVIDYVINSHIVIPQSFLKHFGYLNNGTSEVNYINTKNMKIETAKTNKYGTTYGYYSKYIEDILSQEFETKIANINKKLYDFKNKKVESLNIITSMIETIHNFFDITTYRNPKMLKEVNELSIASRVYGDIDHDFLLNIALKNFGRKHIYKDMKVNLIVNKTNRDFVINDSMISSIICDNGNEIIILPINKKECLALLDKEYFKKYIENGKTYYMNIDDPQQVEMMNRYILKYAKRNNENVIGSKEELEILLKYVSSDIILTK